MVNALVSNIDDPDELGRMKVTFPWLGDKSESHWARVAVPGAGNERGVLIMPEVGDEVLVAFDHGDPRLPYVIGGLYNGKDKPAVPAPWTTARSCKRAIVAAQRPPARARRQGRRDHARHRRRQAQGRLDQKSKKVVVETDRRRRGDGQGRT